MTLDKCRVETQKHIEKVRKYIRFFTDRLTTRGVEHDAAKLESPEVELFAEHTEQLATLEYGSQEYKQALEQCDINKEDISLVYDEKKIYKDDICMDINSYIERIASLEDRMTEAEAAIDDISKKSDLLILS